MWHDRLRILLILICVVFDAVGVLDRPARPIATLIDPQETVHASLRRRPGQIHPDFPRVTIERPGKYPGQWTERGCVGAD